MPKESGMDKDSFTENLLDNEREWRRFLIKQVGKIEEDFNYVAKEIERIKVWNLVFRMIGGAVFALILIWVESKLK